jgi:hypothetical protein
MLVVLPALRVRERVPFHAEVALLFPRRDRTAAVVLQSIRVRKKVAGMLGTCITGMGSVEIAFQGDG